MKKHWGKCVFAVILIFRTLDFEKTTATPSDEQIKLKTLRCTASRHGLEHVSCSVWSSQILIQGEQIYLSHTPW